MMPESPRWDCHTGKSSRSSRSASCDSADAGRVPARFRHESFSDAFEGMHTVPRPKPTPTPSPAACALSPRRTAAARCESPELARSFCARESASRLSDGDRTLLLQVADRNSRALAKRAIRMLGAMRQRPCARASAFLNGLMLSEAVPPRIDGYTLVESDRGTRIFQLDAGRESSRSRRQSRQSRAAAHDRLRFLGFRKVKGTVAEVAELLGGRHDGEPPALSPGMTDARRLHTLLDSSEGGAGAEALLGDGGRFVGLGWMCMQAPSWMGWKSARLRDFLLLEDQSGFRTPDGRSGWVQSLHSVQLPWFQSQGYGGYITRGSMYQSGFVAVPAVEAPAGWVDVMCAVELDLKGGVSDKSHRAAAMKRLSCLAALDHALVSQRLQRISFMDSGQFALRAPEPQRACHICASRIRVFGRHFSCRKCGETMCKKCCVDLRVDVPGTGPKTRRVCARCVIKRAAPEPTAVAPSIAPASKRRAARQLHERRLSSTTSGSGSSGTVGLDGKLLGMLEDAAARSRRSQPRRRTRAPTDPRSVRSVMTSLARISEEERRSSQASSRALGRADGPRESSQPRLSASGGHLAHSDVRLAARSLQDAREASSPASLTRAVRSARGRSPSQGRPRGAKKARHSKRKNERSPAGRHASRIPTATQAQAPSAASDTDSPPPSARGSSLRVQFLMDEIML